MVLQPPEPTITISGPQHIARTVDNLQAGILPFTGVTVVSLMSEEMEEEEDEFLRGEISPSLVSEKLREKCWIMGDFF